MSLLILLTNFMLDFNQWICHILMLDLTNFSLLPNVHSCHLLTV